MSTPQDPPVRNKQKRRRTKKLAAWRIKNAAAKAGATTEAAPKAPAAKATKAATKAAAAPKAPAAKATKAARPAAK